MFKFVILTALFLCACTGDYLTFSLDGDRGPAFSTRQAYCNKFNINGFTGLLTSYFDWSEKNINENKAVMYLRTVPSDFNFPLSNYIQVHSFYIKNNREEYNSAPVTMEVLDKTTSVSVQTVTSIGHDLLSHVNQTVDKFIEQNYFILHDVEGWQGMSLSVFDSVSNKPLDGKSTKILIPPFSADPQEFFRETNKERLLFRLHPFAQISEAGGTTRHDFYSKAKDDCQGAYLPLDTLFKEKAVTNNGTKDPSKPFQELMRNVSSLPDLGG